MFVVLNNLAHAHTYVFQLCQVSEEMLHDLHLQIVVMMHSNELKYLFLWEWYLAQNSSLAVGSPDISVQLQRKDNIEPTSSFFEHEALCPLLVVQHATPYRKSKVLVSFLVIGRVNEYDWSKCRQWRMEVAVVYSPLANLRFDSWTRHHMWLAEFVRSLPSLIRGFPPQNLTS